MYSGLLQGSGSDLRERVLVAGCVGRGRGGCSTKGVDYERNATGQHAAEDDEAKFQILKTYALRQDSPMEI